MQGYTAGIKEIIIMGLLLVLCTCDLFSSTVKSSLVPRPLSRHGKNAELIALCVTLEMRLIFTLLGYFDF